MSLPSYRSRQSDDDFQRHNANRHHREGSGQDRLGQRAAQKDAKYTAIAEQWRYDRPYYLLESWANVGALQGQWVNVEKLEQAGTTSAGEKLWRSK